MRAELEREYVEYVPARLGRMRRVAYLLCGDFDRADDVVQATVERLYLRWRHVRAPGTSTRTRTRCSSACSCPSGGGSGRGCG